MVHGAFSATALPVAANIAEWRHLTRVLGGDPAVGPDQRREQERAVLD